MIDWQYGTDTPREDLTDLEVMAIRDMAHTLLTTPTHSSAMKQRKKIRTTAYASAEEVVGVLSNEFKVSEKTIKAVLDGEISPYIGGPLRPLPLQGCNPFNLESTQNRQRFVRGVLFEAMIILAPKEFEIFAHFNGMKMEEAEKYITGLSPVQAKDSQPRFRSILRRHAEGQTIEQAVSSHSKKLSANVG